MRTDQSQALEAPDKWIGVVTAGVGAVTAVLGMLGTGSTGAFVERLVRNQACVSAMGFVSVEVSIGLAALALVMSGWIANLPKGKRGRWGLLLGLLTSPLIIAAAISLFWDMPCNWILFVVAAGFLVIITLPVAVALILLEGQLDLGRTMLGMSAVLLVSGLLLLTIPALLISLTKERANVVAKLKTGKGRTLEAAIKVAGVPASDMVEVRVDKLRDQPNNKWAPILQNDQLYHASVGPTASGDVDLSLELPLPLRGYTAIGIKAVVIEAAAKQRRTIDNRPRVAGCDVETAGCTIIRMPN